MEGETADVPVLTNEDTHKSHTFEFSIGKHKKCRAMCSRYGTTVWEALQQSRIFNNEMQKNHDQDKEIVIVKERKPICAHFPACLLTREDHLTVEFIKARDKKEGKKKAMVNGHNRGSEMPPRKLLTFTVCTKGGNKIKNGVMKNLFLKRAYEEVIVYAYKGESLKNALRGDGRFKKSLWTTNCGLSDRNEELLELFHLVDECDNGHFKVILIDKSTVVDSQPDTQEEDVKLSKLKSEEDSPVQNPSTPYQESAASGMSPQDDATSSAPVTHSNKRWRAIPDSGEVYQLLCSQFKDLVKRMKDRHNLKDISEVYSFFNVEYGKSLDTCLEIKRVRELTVRSKSVCQVRVNGSAKGSGFLLFDKFILTNGHVIRDVLQQNKLQEEVTAHFDFEDLSDSHHTSVLQVLDLVVAFEQAKNVSGDYYDMALLELSPGTDLPPGLLDKCAYPPQKGGICIIGHPGTGVKKIDPCYIIPPEDRFEAGKKHRAENIEFLQLITKEYWEKNWDIDEVMKKDDQRITYDTCFYHGSSGSPVFDEHCNVIGMHSGGYAYETPKGKMQSVLEYALPLSLTLKKIFEQVIEKKRHDVLDILKRCLEPNKKEFFEDLKKYLANIEGEPMEVD